MKIIMNYIKNVKYVCTTADVWTAPDRRIIGVTAHWVSTSYFTPKLKLVPTAMVVITFYSYVKKH